MSRNVHLRDIDSGGGRAASVREGRSTPKGGRTREMHRTRERARERETARQDETGRSAGDRREDWMGRAGSPIYKGKPGDYDLPFVRSFQLFCPIKISIFSPIAATLSRVRLLQCRSLVRSPLLFFPSSLPRHPPYGSIDRAQPRDSSPSHPRARAVVQPPFSPHCSPFCLSTSFLSFFSLFHLPVSFPLSFWLSLSFFYLFLYLFFLFHFLSLSLSFSTSTYAIPASIFNYWLRERSRTTRKNRETKSLTVSACTQTDECVSLPSRDSRLTV